MRAKKLIICATAIFCFLIGFTATVSSQDKLTGKPATTASAKIYVKPSLIINPPSLFDVKICVSGIEGLYGYEFSLAYNTTVLNCLGVVVYASGDPGVDTNLTIGDSAGRIWVNVTYQPPALPINATLEAELVTISFQVSVRGRSPLDLYNTKLLNADGQQVPHTVEDGLVIPSVPGDVDLDGHVTLSDLVRIAMAYHSKPGDPNWNSNADLNGDGKISLVDVVICALNYNKY